MSSSESDRAQAINENTAHFVDWYVDQLIAREIEHEFGDKITAEQRTTITSAVLTACVRLREPNALINAVDIDMMDCMTIFKSVITQSEQHRGKIRQVIKSLKSNLDRLDISERAAGAAQVPDTEKLI